MKPRLLAIAAAAALIACHYTPPPVLLQGTPPEIATLAGEWDGEYSGAQSGRVGSISLRITAGRDTAIGDVWMVATNGQRMVAAHDARDHRTHARTADMLHVTFVRVAAGRVSGALEPYTAPDCQCTVTTTFSGAVSGDIVEGTFVTRGPGGLEQTGRWRVSRRR
jgi:hypothetical protein